MGKQLALAVVGILVVAGGIWVAFSLTGDQDAADQQVAPTVPAGSVTQSADDGQEAAESAGTVVYDAMVPPDSGEAGATDEAAAGAAGQAGAASADTSGAAGETAPTSSDTSSAAGETATAPTDTSGGETAAAGSQAVDSPKVVPRETLGSQTQTAALPADAEQQAAQQQAPAAGLAPSFDVVRVEKSGETLIAGRATPGSEVTVFDGEKPIGKVTADGTGSWVLLPKQPLEPGTRELFIRSKTPNGDVRESKDAVIVAVRGKEQVPAQQTDAPEEPAVAAAETAPARETAALTLELDETRESGGSQAAGVTTRAEDAGEETPLAVLVPRDGEGASRVLQQPVEGDISDQALVLKAIDYDSSGRVIVSGDALAGARIIVYLDNRAIGETRANENGRWALSPAQPIAPGLHRLRVDQADDGGKVLARVETPFSRADFLTTLPDERFVIVQPGNSLWRIARRTYGDGVRYSVIYQSNQDQIRDPDVIYPGQIFMVPQVN